MHESVVFFCRPTFLSGEAYKQELEKHHKGLLGYAQVMEKLVGPQLLKSNLHAAVCQLKAQCLARGHSGNENESAVERGVQYAKKPVRSRVTEHTEMVMASTALTASCVHVFMSSYDCYDLTLMLPEYRRLQTTDAELPAEW